VAQRSIFRESALEAYRRGTEKDVVPRLVPGPVVAGTWALLVVLACAVALSWVTSVPAYQSARGIVLADGDGKRPAAILFVPPDRAPDVEAGQRVHLEVGVVPTRYAEGVVVGVGREAVTPAEARQRFGTDAVAEPSVIVTVRLESAALATAYAGTEVSGRVRVGTQRPLDLLFPGADSPGGGR
jgi:hypothetical protein